MGTHQGLLSARLTALVAAVAVGVTIGACGSNDDDSGQAGGGANATANTEDARRDQAEIKAVYAQLVGAIQAGDVKAACSLITPQARQKLIRHYDTACPAYLGGAGDNVAGKQPQLTSIKIRGDRALARISTDTDPIPFTKAAGTWQVSGGF